MSDARYFLPDHPSLKDVYTKDDLRALLQAGRLSRSEIVLDDETGLAHLLGDLLASAYREPPRDPARAASALRDEPSRDQVFRAHTPLPEREEGDEAEDAMEARDDDWGEEGSEDFKEPEREGAEAAAPRGEELLYQGHPSWLAYPRALLAVLVFSGAAWLGHYYHAGLPWVIVLASLGVLPVLVVALQRATTTYFITTRRVEIEYGIIGRNTKEVRIPDIRAIDVVQEGFGAIVGIGHVKFDSAAGPAAEVEFKNVRRPHDLKQAVRELQG